MAAAFSPPFFSPRQNQPLDVASTPHFGAATLGDVSEEEPLSGILAFTKYDRAVTYTWAITPSTEKLTVGATLPVPYDALDIGATVEAKVPLHVSDSTECSGPDTGSGQFLGGVWAAKNIHTAQAVQAAETVVTNGTAQLRMICGSVTTPSNVPSTIVAYAPTEDTSNHIRVAASFTTALSSGTYSYEYKCSNVGGVITNSAPQLITSAIDHAIITAYVGPAVSDDTTVAQAHGLEGVEIKWGASMQILTTPI